MKMHAEVKTPPQNNPPAQSKIVIIIEVKIKRRAVKSPSENFDKKPNVTKTVGRKTNPDAMKRSVRKREKKGGGARIRVDNQMPLSLFQFKKPLHPLEPHKHGILSSLPNSRSNL